MVVAVEAAALTDAIEMDFFCAGGFCVCSCCFLGFAGTLSQFGQIVSPSMIGPSTS